MRFFGTGTDKEGTAAAPRRRARATVAIAVGVAALAAGCSSSPSSSTPPTSASTSKAPATTSPKSGAPSTTIPPKAYLTRSGTGDKSFSTSGLPSKWMATWRFDCTHPVRKANFTLDVGVTGGHAVRVTSQTGLGGGGQHPYTSGGSYHFSVSTTCNWDVTAEAMPSK